MSSKDVRFMTEALRLAGTARGLTSPDPMVGAVVVRGGRIVGKGHHADCGTPHAETVALKRAGKKARGATLYINLEPCCHFGNNPPCVNQIIHSGIKKVVAATRDPNPLVCGKGFRKLRGAGVEVVEGVMEESARKMNEAFFKHITTGLPFVTLKSAMSLDGKIATRTGDSRWITSKLSRRTVHGLREGSDAVMVGVGTVLCDDPLLNVRMIRRKKRDPLKVIIDPLARAPLGAKIFRTNPEKTVLVASKSAPPGKLKRIRRTGARVIQLATKRGIIPLDALMKVLGSEGIMSVMIEGGQELGWRAIEAGIVDKMVLFVAPKVIGGREAPTPVGGEGVRDIRSSIPLKDMGVSVSGSDVIIEAYL